MEDGKIGLIEEENFYWIIINIVYFQVQLWLVLRDFFVTFLVGFVYIRSDDILRCKNPVKSSLYIRLDKCCLRWWYSSYFLLINIVYFQVQLCIRGSLIGSSRLLCYFFSQFRLHQKWWRSLWHLAILRIQ